MEDLTVRAIFALTESERKALENQYIDLDAFECILVCPWERVEDFETILHPYRHAKHACFRGEEVAIAVVR